MQITRSSTEGTTATAKGPAEWFTGDVTSTPSLPRPPRHARRRTWSTSCPARPHGLHGHPLGQTLFVTEGIGLCQRRGGPVEIIRPGDRAYIEPDEEHWHGATPGRLMVHLALNEVDDEHVAAHWGEHVSDDEYAVPAPTQAMGSDYLAR